ncbi:hypothetical protein, partial [Spirosoma pomorum]
MLQRTLPLPTAVSTAVGLAQVKAVELALMVKDGALWSAVTLTLAEVVQPLGAVKVTLYTAALLTVMEAVVAPVLQRTDPVPTAVSTAVGLAQLKVVLDVVILNDGAFWSAVTLTLDEVVQPLGAVSVTLYTPALLTLIEAVVAPVLQRTDPVPTAVSTAVGLAQLKVVLDVVILKDGALWSAVTFTLDEVVQPLGAVKVTEYTFALLTVMEAVVAPVLQRTDPVPTAVSTAVGLAQLKVVELTLMVSDGALWSAVTLTLEEVVQPLGAVSVTLYTPALLTVIEAVVAPVLQRTLPLPTAVSTAVGLAQVKAVELALMVKDGALWSAVTLTLEEVVQPLG